MATKKAIISLGYLPSNEIKIDQRSTDLMIWRFARTNQYTILTFDEDFAELQNLFSYPPKIIWLRTGNVRTAEIASLLTKLESDLSDFLNNDELGIYEIYPEQSNREGRI